MDYEMVAGIAGDVLLELESIEALLDWYLPEDCYVITSNAVNPALQRIQYWMTEVGQDWTINSGYDDTLIDNLVRYGDPADLSLIVLGVEGNEKLIQQAWQNNIEVADLTRAMYIVQQGVDLDDVVYEPQTHPHEVTDGLGGRSSLDVFASLDQSESRLAGTTRKQIEEIVTGLIRLHEEGFHQPQPTPEEKGQAMADAIDDFRAGKVRCLKNKAGEIRVSPRAKAKPGEEEVWLTQEEIDEKTNTA